jgi:hypothetical protein
MKWDTRKGTGSSLDIESLAEYTCAVLANLIWTWTLPKTMFFSNLGTYQASTDILGCKMDDIAIHRMQSSISRSKVVVLLVSNMLC